MSRSDPAGGGQRTQMMAVRDDTSVAGPDKRSKMMAIHEDAHTRIRALLTDEQKPKSDAMMARQRERMANRKNGQAAPPPSPAQ